MPIPIDLQSNTLDFDKALFGGPFGFITGIKTLSFLYIFFMKILSFCVFACFLDLFLINVTIQPSKED